MNRVLRRFDELEIRTCMRINRLSRRQTIRSFFAVISKLGDGWLWYALIAAWVVRYGGAAAGPALRLCLAAVAGLVLYRGLKQRLVRERPFVSYRAIRCGTAPLDRYSFPSGHTMHAVSFTILLAEFAPGSLYLTLPFTVLVALSRVVLGLHYPTDVLAGAVLGAALALGVLTL